MNIGYERIAPTPVYPAGLTAAGLSAIPWSPGNVDVKTFKASIKTALREAQNGRCCYCRRMLSDVMTTHLEHFVEQSVHRWLTYEIQNLALSCPTCNSKKNASFSKLGARLSRIASSKTGVRVKVKRAPALVAPLAENDPLPTISSAYRWVHPHFDNFSDHIDIKKGWIFTWSSKKGQLTIKGMELNALAQIERRALSERMAARSGGLSILLGGLAELNHANAKDVCAAIATELRRRAAKL